MTPSTVSIATLWLVVSLMLVLALGGCAQLSSASIVPSFDCAGKGIVTFSAGPASAMATFDCGPSAYVHQVQPSPSAPPAHP